MLKNPGMIVLAANFTSRYKHLRQNFYARYKHHSKFCFSLFYINSNKKLKIMKRTLKKLIAKIKKEKYVHLNVSYENSKTILRYLDNKNLQDCIKETNLIKYKGRLIDDNGHIVCETPDSDTGVLDFNGSYNMEIVMSLSSLKSNIQDNTCVIDCLKSYVANGGKLDKEFDFIFSE